MLDILEDFMVLRSIRFARLDGSTRRPRRTLDIKLVSGLVFPEHGANSFSCSSSKRFPVRVPLSLLSLLTFIWDMASAYQVFLISTKAGGLGESALLLRWPAIGY